MIFFDLVKRIYNYLQRLFRLFSYFIIAPKLFTTILHVIIKYFISSLLINRYIGIKFSNNKNDFIKFCNNKLFFDQRDLFSNNIPSWLYIFEKFSLKNKELEFLEIGSFEGRTSCFFLSNFKKIHLTCVDTFKPFHELQDNNDAKFNNVFENFKKNTLGFSERLTIEKEKSSVFFIKNKKEFDLIYIDGSHEYEDVKNDAEAAFKIIKNNGIIIFDDFLWHIKQNMKSSITYAIIEFLHKNKKNLKILHSNYQIIVQKV